MGTSSLRLFSQISVEYGTFLFLSQISFLFTSACIMSERREVHINFHIHEPTSNVGAMGVGVELISTLLGKVLLGYEHNYSVHVFLYVTEKSRGSNTED